MNTAEYIQQIYFKQWIINPKLFFFFFPQETSVTAYLVKLFSTPSIPGSMHTHTNTHELQVQTVQTDISPKCQ